MIPTLSILCVTRGGPHAWPFLETMAVLASALGSELVIAADRPSPESFQRLRRIAAAPRHGSVQMVEGSDYVESVLDEAIGHCQGEYVLRLDDDERCSAAMFDWLDSRAWFREPSWAFATAGLWGDPQSVLVMPELWPQCHTRLSQKAIAGHRKRIHAPSPYGRGAIAPVVLEHWKFLVKSLDERKAIAERYDRIKSGAGKRCHSIPELVYDEFWLAPLGDGTFRTWSPEEVRRVPVHAAVSR